MTSSDKRERATPGEHSIGRIEDDRLVTGQGRFTGSKLPGNALFVAFRRSEIAHGRILDIDHGAGAEEPGVSLIWTDADASSRIPGLAPAADGLVHRDGSASFVAPRPPLARGTVRFVGEPVAAVAAETALQASLAADEISVDYDELPALTDLDWSHWEGGDPLWPEAGAAGALDWLHGDAEAAKAALAKAPVQVTAEMRLARLLGMPMEPFAAIADYDPSSERWTVTVPSQGAHQIRAGLARQLLQVPEERIRVITPDVGGAFGLRIQALPEVAVLAAMAKETGRPMVWIADRLESALAEPHARDMLIRVTGGFTEEGQLLALRADCLANIGAYNAIGGRAAATMGLMPGLLGPYKVPTHAITTRARHTTTAPIGPYRGAGQPEGALMMDRLMQKAAGQLGLGQDEIRRRNLLTERPVETAAGYVLDAPSAATHLERAGDALTEIEAALPAPRTGRVRGRGVSLYAKINARNRTEKATLKVREDGQIELRFGSQANGQGHENSLVRLAAQRLSLPVGRFVPIQGDTDEVALGFGTGGSSMLATTGSGVALSAENLLEQAREAAAERLECAEQDLIYADGEFRVAGSDIVMPFFEAARGLTGRSEISNRLNYAVGAHGTLVEIDRETGVLEILGHAACDATGPILDRGSALGQITGSIVQAMGQVIGEQLPYDPESGQPLAPTPLDYLLPRAADLPAPELLPDEDPDGGNPLGVRGVGESGISGALASVIRAVVDAVPVLDESEIHLPLTAERLWRALRDGD